MRESKIAHFMVMFAQSVDRLLLLEVPNNDVRVLSTLSRGEQASIVADGEASDRVIVCS